MVTHHRTASRYSTGHHSVDEWCIAVARHLNIVQGMRRGPNFSRHVSQLQFWKKKKQPKNLQPHQKTVHSYPDNREIELHFLRMGWLPRRGVETPKKVGMDGRLIDLCVVGVGLLRNSCAQRDLKKLTVWERFGGKGREKKEANEGVLL